MSQRSAQHGGAGHDPEAMLSAIEQSPLFFVVGEGPDLRLVGLNRQTRGLIPGREYLGRPLRSVFTELQTQQFLDMYDQVYRTGETAAGQEWRGHFARPDGSTMEVYITFKLSPWLAPDGSIRGVIGTGTDVTESVRARLAAERESALLQQRYDETRDMISAIQSELLSGGLPVVPGVRLSASYLLADGTVSAGGDWFDAVLRPGGTIALSVGDVVGHGVTASGVMGQLRAVLQDRLSGGAGIREALGAADRVAGRLSAAYATTICLVILDPADGSFAYCTAGHPPPLFIGADGTTRYLPVTGGGPLATGSLFPVRTDRLAVGDLLLLYSDGILERPGRAVQASTVELAKVAADAAFGRILHTPAVAPADRVCTQTLELLLRTAGHNDDITRLAAHRADPPPPFAASLPPILPAVPALRHDLYKWLDSVEVTEQDAMLLQHALGELLTNAIEHGAGSGGVIQVRADLGIDGYIEASVTDPGHWREPVDSSERGRGLALVAQLVDALRVTPAADGTVATVRLRLSRPARMLTAHELIAGPPAPVTTDPELLLVLGVPGAERATVRVDGPVDAVTAPQLQHELLGHSRGGTRPLVVDLTGVTFLASIGVAALHLLARQHREQRTDLTLYAAAGSVAQQVLALVGLPHITQPPH